MSESTQKQPKGVATLFDTGELKKYFKNYLTLIGIAEIFIFFVSFVSQLGPETVPFPWRSYFFAAFIVPIAITFILGLCIMGFNYYLYGDSTTKGPHPVAFAQDEPPQGYLSKFRICLYSIRQIPFFLCLVILGICAGIIYEIEAILAFIGHAGGKTAQYLLVALAAVLAVASGFGLVWMVLNYKLQKKSIEYHHKYRRAVAEHMGLIILDDQTVIDNNGNVMGRGKLPVRESECQKSNPASLPKFSESAKKDKKPRDDLSS